jgi:hypothetical protein
MLPAKARNAFSAAALALAQACSPTAAPNSAPAPAAEASNALSAAERAEGWRLLFDGRTTAGWRGYRSTTMPSGWQVVDGALTRVARGGDIVSVEEFANFELALEWKVEPGGNSGVFYRAGEDDDAVYWTAPEMQVLDDSGHADGRSLLTSAGSVYGLYAVPRHLARPAGQWNQARIVVNGNHVEHWLNSVRAAAYELGSDDWLQRVAASKFAPHARFGRNARGLLALQDHGDRVAFRNIKIRVLP